MPKGTKVHKCVQRLKGRKGVNAYAVCQASTGQSYATGRKLKPNLSAHGGEVVTPSHVSTTVALMKQHGLG